MAAQTPCVTLRASSVLLDPGPTALNTASEPWGVPGDDVMLNPEREVHLDPGSRSSGLV